MSLLRFDNVSLTLGGKSILDTVSLQVQKEDRLGLIGPNGSGKTTLLRLMSGQHVPDGGSIVTPKNVRIGYLPQDVSFEVDSPLLRYVLESVPGKQAIEDELAEIEAKLMTEGDEETLISLSERLADLYEKLNAYENEYAEHEAHRILGGLGFKSQDMVRNISEFSGGWRVRALLAALLFQKPDVLLLDEPTNHLDMPTVGWFSGFLKRYRGSFVMISHDREFLNEQIKRVVSFVPEGVRVYRGDLDAYEKQREEERVILENRAANLAKQKADLQAFIDRFRAKASKAAQVQSKVKLLEKLGDVTLQTSHATIGFKFPPTEKAGKNVLETEGLTKHYGDNHVLNNVSSIVQRGKKIALVGLNGAGKTTFLRLLANELESTGGEVIVGHNVTLGYYAQHHCDILKPELTVYDAVRYGTDGINHKTLRAALGAMMFGDLEIEKKIKVLSGGERARVALAQLLVAPGNVLLMDEPTNHLDLDSSERLAEALSSFDGTLLFVSHNRAFIRALATDIWIVEDGGVRSFPGTLDDYLAQSMEPAAEETAETATTKTAAPQKKQRSKKERLARRQARAPLADAAKSAEASVAALESELSECDGALATADAGHMAALSKKRAAVDAKLSKAMQTWEDASAALEAFDADA